MSFLNLTYLTLSAMVCIPPSATSRHSDVRTAADSEAVLTTDIFSRMVTFWHDFQKEPDSVLTAGTKIHRRSVSFYVGDPTQRQPQEVHLPSVVDMTAMAAKFPSVAAELANAHLTAQQWERYRRAFLAAQLTSFIMGNTPVWQHLAASKPAAAIWQNVKFTDQHGGEIRSILMTAADRDASPGTPGLSDLMSLVETGPSSWMPPGIWFSPSPAVGETAPQLVAHTWFNTPHGGPTTTFGDGHWYVMDFTSPTCAICQTLYPLLDSLHQRFAKHGVRFLYVNALTGSYGTQTQLASAVETDSLRSYFLKDHAVTTPVLLTSFVEMTRTYYRNVIDLGLPRTVVIDGTGKIRAVSVGANVQKELANQLTALVGGSGNRASN